MKAILKFGAVVVLAAVAALPLELSAQTTSTNKTARAQKSPPVSPPPAAAEKKPKAGPFYGKLKALDKAAQTITVGKRTFLITPKTRLNKAGHPATLNDAVVGEVVSGYVRPDETGKLAATVVNFGPKPGSKAAAKKKTKTEP
jgi:hypothetical protein